MRIAKNLLLVAAMLLMLSGVSQAAFDNSHHDMRTFTGTTKEGCLQCHGRQSAQSFTGSVAALGNVGGLCLQRCHSGAGIIGALGTVVPQGPVNVDDRNYTTAARPTANYDIVYFNAGSHGNIAANLRNGGWTGAGAVTWPPATANTWPYMGASIANIECTSCHAVHDNLNAPFLWAPLGPTTINTASSFCDRCHSESARSGNFLTNAPNGNHPINFVVDNAAAATRTDANGRHPRRIVFQTYNALRVFDVPNPAGSTMIGAPTAGTAWATGGHIVIPGAAATQNTTAIPNFGTGTTTAAMGCYTCHSAHKTSVYGENNLVNVATVDNTGTWSPLCVGCHGPATSLAGDQNEAAIGTTQYGHPVGSAAVPTAGLYTTTIGGFRFAVNTGISFTDQENNVGWGTGNALLCTTCHQVHGGATGSMALAKIGQTTTTAICKMCHNGVGIPNVHDASKGGNLGDATTNRANLANAHHVTNTTVSNGMGKAGDTGTVLYVNTSPSWAGTITRAPNLGVLTSGGMDCADCHTFNGTAHNW